MFSSGALPVTGQNNAAPAGARQPSVAFLPWADRFEDFYDTIGVSVENFQDKLTGTWLF
jgi:hypothetical protein